MTFSKQNIRYQSRISSFDTGCFQATQINGTTVGPVPPISIPEPSAAHPAEIHGHQGY